MFERQDPQGNSGAILDDPGLEAALDPAPLLWRKLGRQGLGIGVGEVGERPDDVAAIDLGILACEEVQGLGERHLGVGEQLVKIPEVAPRRTAADGRELNCDEILPDATLTGTAGSPFGELKSG